MDFPFLVADALSAAWDRHESGDPLETSLPASVVEAVSAVLRKDSAPNRSILLTIPAATAQHPDSNPSAVQVQAGVDRRSQAKKLGPILSDFQERKGLRLKISQDPGVSNQWREPEINEEWVSKRRPHDYFWAEGFRLVVDWIGDVEGEERADRSRSVLTYVAGRFVEEAAGGTFDYPRFPASPRVAMNLARAFIEAAPNRPDATEAVVAAAARSLSAVMIGAPEVERGDTNSPDSIDVLITSSDGKVSGGIEVTDAQLTLTKLQHEVLPAMQKHGLDRALIVSRGVRRADAKEIDEWIPKVYARFSQRIDLSTIDDIETWLSFPGTPRDLPSEFLSAVGAELDQYSATPNRQAWFKVLTDYTSRVDED